MPLLLDLKAGASSLAQTAQLLLEPLSLVTNPLIEGAAAVAGLAIFLIQSAKSVYLSWASSSNLGVCVSWLFLVLFKLASLLAKLLLFFFKLFMAKLFFAL
jgi:hypothetical protein